MSKFDFSTDDKLLDIEAICEKLSISRSTFERLRKPQGLIGALMEPEYAGLPTFPEPTVILGRSPRWSATTLNAWIASSPVYSGSSGRWIGLITSHQKPDSKPEAFSAGVSTNKHPREP